MPDEVPRRTALQPKVWWQALRLKSVILRISFSCLFRRGCVVARQRCPLFVALISVTGAAIWPSLGVGLNVSGSAPRGLYRAVADAPGRGALVVACLPAAVGAFGRARGYLGPGDCPHRVQPVLKSIGAVPGDIVALGDDTVTVNGVSLLIRPIALHDTAARPLPHIASGSYRVARGEVWLFGLSHGSSWDSRYFGAVPVTLVRSVVRPVLRLQ